MFRSPVVPVLESSTARETGLKIWWPHQTAAHYIAWPPSVKGKSGVGGDDRRGRDVRALEQRQEARLVHRLGVRVVHADDVALHEIEECVVQEDHPDLARGLHDARDLKGLPL